MEYHVLNHRIAIQVIATFKTVLKYVALRPVILPQQYQALLPFVQDKVV